MSKIKLLNNQGDEVTIEHSDTASAQGNSVVNIKDVTKQVDTIADLKALDGTDKLVYVTGYHNKGDGAFGSHVFEWDATSIEADNGGTIIKLDGVDTGRYKLKYSGSVNVKWFGAFGDGVAYETSAIQKAINNSKDIYIPVGTYLLDNTIFLKDSTSIIGESSGSTILNILGNYYKPSSGILYANSNSSSETLNNIEIKNLTINGNVDTLGFSQHDHSISLHGVRDATIENCNIIGFRGDGIYIGSGLSDGDERHNYNISIINNIFDGINFDNRNSISIIDCDGCNISNNIFKNTSRSDMPGAIDIEPNTGSFYRAQNIQITNNNIISTHGGLAAISISIYRELTEEPKNFTINNNIINGTANGIVVRLAPDKNYRTLPVSLNITGNIITSGHRGIDISHCYITGVIISNNAIYQSSTTLLGFYDTDIIENFIISSNSFFANNSTQGVLIKGAKNGVISSNSFYNFTEYNIYLGTSTGVIENISIIGNVSSIVSGAGFFVECGSGIDGSSCSYFNNIGNDKHNFPAYKTDNAGINVQIFTSSTLPDSFPIGKSISIINGDTGVPYEGGHEGTLITYRYCSQSGWEKWTYQLYFYANNSADIGNFYFRQRKLSSNDWEAWTLK